MNIVTRPIFTRENPSKEYLVDCQVLTQKLEMFILEKAMYHVAVLTPTCMYEDDCDVCPQGRKGIYCELVGSC